MPNVFSFLGLLTKRGLVVGVLSLFVIQFASCLAPKSDPYFTERYTELVRTYFIACSFAESNQLIGKWDKKEVTYSVKGFSRKHHTFVKATFAKLSLLKNLPRFKFVEGSADIAVEMPETEQGFHDSHGLKTELRGFTDYKKNSQGFFIYANVGINPAQSDQNIQISIHHELLHALGFLAHPTMELKESSAFGTRYFSRVDPLDKISPIYPQIDQRILELLYEESMPIIVSRKQAALLLGVHDPSFNFEGVFD